MRRPAHGTVRGVTADRPLVFLDVDGPLIPFRARRPAPRGKPAPSHPPAAPAVHPSLRSGAPPAGNAVRPGGEGGNPLLGRLDPEDGRRLLALGCPLVWATTWMHEANEVVAPRLGLPELPVVGWPDEDEEPVRGLHWKTAALLRWAAGRPFVWLDDEITGVDRRWVAAHHPERALLHRVDSGTGLTGSDFATVRRWLGLPGSEDGRDEGA